MVDLGSIQAALGGLKAAGDIAKSMANLRDAAALQAKTIDLQQAILAAQESALSAMTEQSSLIDRIRNLEEEVARMKAWDADKDRYELTDLGNGKFTYSLKEQTNSTEPSHQLCANCYNHKEKSILQSETRNPGRIKVLVCHNCDAEIITRGIRRSEGERPKVITKRPSNR